MVSIVGLWDQSWKKPRETFQEVFRENNRESKEIDSRSHRRKNKTGQDSCIHSFAVSCYSLTYWHLFSPHGFFFYLLWLILGRLELFSTAVLVPWVFCPGSAGSQNHCDLDKETTRDSKSVSNIY